MIHLITGYVGTGKTFKLFEKVILSSRLHGKKSLIFTEDRVAARQDLQNLMNMQSVPDLMVCEMSQEDFLWNVENNVNPVIPTSQTVRIGVDYSNLSPRIVAACHKLSEMGYEVFVTCNVMRQN